MRGLRGLRGMRGMRGLKGLGSTHRLSSGDWWKAMSGEIIRKSLSWDSRRPSVASHSCSRAGTGRLLYTRCCIFAAAVHSLLYTVVVHSLLYSAVHSLLYTRCTALYTRCCALHCCTALYTAVQRCTLLYTVYTAVHLLLYACTLSAGQRLELGRA